MLVSSMTVKYLVVFFDLDVLTEETQDHHQEVYSP